MSGEILADQYSSKIGIGNFLEKNSICLDFILVRDSFEKKMVENIYESLEKNDWDYESFCNKKGYSFNGQINIFAEKEKMGIGNYLKLLFENDYLSRPLIYDSGPFFKNGKAYYSVYTVWAADINFGAAKSQLGDVEQISFEFKKSNDSYIPINIARKSHYYPNSSKIKWNNICIAFNLGNHYPFMALDKKESIGIMNGCYNIKSFKNKEIHYFKAENFRANLGKNDFFKENISKKFAQNLSISLPFEKYWSYNNPEFMFSKKGKVLGSLDAAIHTF